MQSVHFFQLGLTVSVERVPGGGEHEPHLVHEGTERLKLVAKGLLPWFFCHAVPPDIERSYYPGGQVIYISRKPKRNFSGIGAEMG